MSKEKPDDFSSWSERLERREGISGLSLADKGAAWEKLYGRLKQQQHRPTSQKDHMLRKDPTGQKDPVLQKGRIAGSWFWIAAACLFIALIPAAILFKGVIQNKNGESQKDRNMAIGTDSKLPADPASLETLAMPANPAHKKKGTRKPLNNTKPEFPDTTADQTLSSKTRQEQEILTGKETSGVSTFSAGDSAFLSAMPFVRAVDSGLHIAQQPVFHPKRKIALRVVHINEINEPAITGPSLTSLPAEGGFRINLGYRGRLSHPSVAAFQPDPSFLKIKTSSQNQ
ncbi:hypothetical protein ACX0G9_14270 [Flavitalea flava]